MKPSTPGRFVPYINLGILMVLVAALGLVYWYAWRPLPQRSGVIEAPVSRPVTVSFDALGEPHIRADHQEDALVA